jgi:DNA-binding NtrC family response regulator
MEDRRLPQSRPTPVDGAPGRGAARAPWPPDLLGASAPARLARDVARQAAAPDARALIVTEPGLDAHAVARAIHSLGSPPAAPLMAVDCGAAGRGVEESLFGSAGGLLAARGGTLFLEHVTDLPAAVQARLARAVRDGEYRTAGHGRSVPVRVRLLASAAPAIDADVDDGAFRADLFRRLSALRIDVPPLRLRPEDIGTIARHLAASTGDGADRPALRFTGAALGFLAALPWDGNLRELTELVEALARRAPVSALRVEDVLGQIRLDRPFAPVRYGCLRDARREFEREYIAAVLRQHGWRMSDAAKTLGIQRTNLYRKARQLKIPRVKVTN